LPEEISGAVSFDDLSEIVYNCPAFAQHGEKGFRRTTASEAGSRGIGKETRRGSCESSADR